MEKSKRKSRKLVLGYLERVSSKVFSDFSTELTELVSKQHGVYALYKGDRLYYVGLATNLRNRIKHHRLDKHAGKWDKFSLYLVRNVEHIKEIESLILRIATPKGNAVRGRLPGAENLKRDLQAKIQKAQKKQLGKLLGSKIHSRQPRKKKKVRESNNKNRQPSLAPYIKRGFRIRRVYKGKLYIATVLNSGRIKYDGDIYNSPSMAGTAIVNRPVAGWHFWKYRTKKGEWVKLDELRKK